MGTFAELSFAEALRLVGRHAIVRDDPCFGRRGRVHHVIADEAAGFLVCVVLFKQRKNLRGEWEEIERPTPDARRYWAPGKVEIAV